MLLLERQGLSGLVSYAAASLEIWAFESVVFLAGLMPNSEVTTSLAAICVNTQDIAYMIALGLSAAASTRVSNKLGAGRPKLAKHAMAMSLKLSTLFVLPILLSLTFGHDIWVGFFTDSPSIIKKFADMTPLLVVSIAIDLAQTVFSGVARGNGWQHLVLWVNLGSYYFIAVPIAYILGFKFNLYVKGLWIGLIYGISCQACILMLITLFRKWTKIDLPEERNENTTIIV